MYLVCFQKPCSRLECCELLLGRWWWLMSCVASQCSKQRWATLKAMCCTEFVLIFCTLIWWFFSPQFLLGPFSLIIWYVETSKFKPRTSLFSEESLACIWSFDSKPLNNTCRRDQKLGEIWEKWWNQIYPSRRTKWWDNTQLTWVRLKIFTGRYKCFLLFLDKLSFSSTCVEQNLTCPTPEEASNELSWDLQTFAQRLENLLYLICHFLNLVLFTIVFMHFFLNVCHCILYNATLNS